MIIEYPNGSTFVEDNSSFLDENRYMSSFFYLDAPALLEFSKKNYALKVQHNNKKLLVLKVEPYHTMLYGNPECVEEFLAYVHNQKLEIDGALCAMDIGDKLIELSPKLLNRKCFLQIGMDFMKTNEYTEESSKEVERATLDDVDELEECLNNFFKDCGLQDRPNRDNIIEKIETFRIIRKDNKIVSLSRMGHDTENSARISTVYTRPEYRGQGFGRKVTNTLKNEIIANGQTATLHVDQANPISNHIYSSLGFKKVFSKGIYLVENQK